MANKVIHAVTISQSLNLMRGQLKFLTGQGYEVKAICSNGDNIKDYEQTEGVEVLPLDMEREISLTKDLQALIKCVKLIRRERPDIVSAGTPKAGLIVTMAAYLCGVPIRVYNIRGLRLETTTGLKRKILMAAEKTASAAATHVLSVSPSLKDRVVELGITPEHKIVTLGKGSSNGFSLTRFQNIDEGTVENLRKQYGLTKDHLVLGFVGRLTKDKGVDEMVLAFRKLSNRYPNLKLLVIGEFEAADAVKEQTRKDILENPNIIYAGYQKDPVPFYKLMDLFVFLTKREGFGNVAVEASLAGVPVIAANVTGARDTVVDGKTGFLVDPANQAEVEEKMERLLSDGELRNRMAEDGKRWAEENFSNESIWKEMDSYYQMLLAQKSVALGELR